MASREWLGGVQGTALGVARVRAEESRRPDRLFEDPYAEAFVAATEGAFAKEQARSAELAEADVVRNFINSVIIRTRFFDDYLLEACASGCRQVVLLAAGLDTRAYRLAWPEQTRLFELDLPGVLGFKEGVLAERAATSRCRRTALAVDLREDWPGALREAGFQQGQPTAWLVEGLMIYLSPDEAARLLTSIDALSAPGSRVSFEHGTVRDSGMLAAARALPAMDRYTSLWKGGLGTETPGWLTRHGWTVETYERADVAASFGRPVPGRSSGGFLVGTRQER
jgi:methyltransferase (TIGR00027 family)